MGEPFGVAVVPIIQQEATSMRKNTPRRFGLTVTAGAAIGLIVGFTIAIRPSDGNHKTSGQGQGPIAFPLVLQSSTIDGDDNVDPGEYRLPVNTIAGRSVVLDSSLYQIVDGNVVLYDVTDLEAPEFVARTSNSSYTNIFPMDDAIVVVENVELVLDNPIANMPLNSVSGARLRLMWREGDAIVLGNAADVAGIVTSIGFDETHMYIGTYGDAFSGELDGSNIITGLISASVDEDKDISIDDVVSPGMVVDMIVGGDHIFLLQEIVANQSGANEDPRVSVLRVFDSSVYPPVEIADSVEIEANVGMLATDDNVIIVVGDEIVTVDVSLPETPEVIDSYALLSRATCVDFQNGQAVIGTENDGVYSIKRFEIHNNLSISLVDDGDAVGAVNSVSRIDNRLVAGTGSGVVIYEIDGVDGMSPIVGPKMTREWYYDVAANDENIFALDWWGEISVWEVVGGNMSLVRKISIEDHEDERAVSLAVSEDYLAVALTESIVVYDISNVQAITIVGELSNLLSAESPYNPFDVAIDGSVVAVAVGSMGVMVIDISGNQIVHRATIPPIIQSSGAASTAFESYSVIVGSDNIYDISINGVLRKTYIGNGVEEKGRLPLVANGGRLAFGETVDSVVVSKGAGGVKLVDVSNQMFVVDEFEPGDVRWIADMIGHGDEVVTISTFSPGLRLFDIDGTQFDDQVIDLAGMIWGWRGALHGDRYIISRGNELVLIERQQNSLVVVDEVDVAG